MKQLMIVTIFILLQFYSFSQIFQNDIKNNKRIALSELAKELVSNDSSQIDRRNIDYYGDLDLYQYILENIPNIKLTKDSLIVVNRKVNLTNCRLGRWIELRKFLFKKDVTLRVSALLPGPYFEGEVATLRIDSSVFDRNFAIALSEKPAFAIELNSSSFYGDFSIFEGEEYSGITQITRCSFYPSPKKSRLHFRRYQDEIKLDNLLQSVFSICSNDLVFQFRDNVLDFQFDRKFDNVASIKARIDSKAKSNYIDGNQINSNIDQVIANDSLFFLKILEIYLNQSGQDFTLTNNDFEIPVALILGFDLVSLEMCNNKFSELGFTQFKIPDNANICWNDILQSNVGLRTRNYGNFGSNTGFYNANTADHLEDLNAYRDLVKFYKKFYDNYRVNGDIRSSNQVFVKIKDLETRRLRYEHNENPNFNSFFRVKLNELLKFYTAFGTDPARAIIISFWLLIAFAVFYFFFPSTWDISSKSKLITDFKDFIQKNEHGYVKPFFRLLLGFFVSILNALTLSLNAFVTLGFGEIPTKGLARYVTIIQGFLGWFLLSLFTVALLNQVIF